MTRMIKYKELRAELERDNKVIHEDLNSKDWFARMRALYIQSLECKGKRVKE